MRPNPSLSRQHGGFLLEALVSVLIVSIGILGIVGLISQSIQYTNDAQYRAEAVYLANTVVAQMWADDRNVLAAKYMSPGQSGYDEFKARVDTLPGAAAILNNPTVTIVAPGASGSVTSVDVTVVVQWRSPGDPLTHTYSTTATIGQNL